MQNIFNIYSVIAAVSGLLFFSCTMAVIFLAIKKWDPALRSVAARRFRVEIDMSGKGQWQVVSDIAWYRKLGIELIQLVLYIFLFFIWSIGGIALIIVLEILRRILGA